MSDRGAARSRGRGRGRDSRKPPHGPGTYSQEPSTSYQSSSSDRHGSQQPAGAWGRKPGHPGSQAPYERQHSGQSSGSRATERAGSTSDRGPGFVRERESSKMDVDTSGGGDGATLGRGAMRGRRVILPEIHTKPANLVTKKGTTGQPVMLQTNYFKLLTTTDWCLYQYRVDFSPEEDRTVVRKGLLRLHKEAVGTYIFDGTVLYTSQRLKDNLELLSVRQSDDQKIRITIRFVGDMVKGDQHYLQVFNIIMRKCLDLLKLQLVGRDYFDARSKIEVRDYHLELWPGYATSIRQHENDILMCCGIIHKVMRQQTLLDILNEHFNQNNRDYKRFFQDQVTGLVVLTDYNNNTYRITDVDFDATPSSTFQLKNGERITYKDYYKKKYQITIRNSAQPMLVTKMKSKDRRAGQGELIYLVPELCRATGLTDDMRANMHLMRAMSDHTRIAPRGRIDKLMMFNRRLSSERTIVQELKDWNLTLDHKLADIPSRILPQESIVLGGNKKVPSGQFADWTRDLIDKTLFNTVQLNNWVVICTNRAKQDTERFIQTLQKVASGLGCRFVTPRFYYIDDDRSNTYSITLEKIMSSSNPELVYCVVSNNRVDRYGAIKKKCLVDRPVPSQVILAKNLTKNVRSIATKVAIQLVCKLGGAPWSVELPPIDLMVVGFDVCHDPNNKSRDFGAMVATLDRSLTRYFSAVSAHTSGEELCNEFSVNLCKALHCYQQLNKRLPSHIVIYRDGVGEGQVNHVVEHEVEQIKQKLGVVYGETPLKMAFIIVTKRINSRFFYNQNNPPPGTVVDDVVTNPMRYDFFIVSQSVRQGTVTPTAYNVVADTTGWRADQMQRITYKLTHMYYNWSGTVRVPAPCQYAHKLAFLVSQFIYRPPSTQMQNLLYFL
ncbi:aubergine [Augochlora pura]